MVIRSCVILIISPSQEAFIFQAVSFSFAQSSPLHFQANTAGSRQRDSQHVLFLAKQASALGFPDSAHSTLGRCPLENDQVSLLVTYSRD